MSKFRGRRLRFLLPALLLALFVILGGMAGDADPVVAARVSTGAVVTPTLSSPAFTGNAFPVPQGPVVHVIFYWRENCENCHQVMSQTLPPLQARYGDKLDIRFVELKTDADIATFYIMAASFGISKDNAGVPLLFIGDYALLGAEEIPTEFPGLIETYLAAGGVDFPDSARQVGLNLASAPTTGVCRLDEESCVTPTPAAIPTAAPLSQGFELVYVSLGLLVIALGYTLMVFVNALRGMEPALASPWKSKAMVMLLILGLLVAGYLSFVELQGAKPVCGPVGNCEEVQSSSYARLFGILPVAVLGLMGYLGLLVSWWIGNTRQDWFGRMAPVATLGMALFGASFSIYLSCLELFVIHAVCAWCVSSSVIMGLILLLSADPGIRAFNRSFLLRKASPIVSHH